MKKQNKTKYYNNTGNFAFLFTLLLTLMCLEQSRVIFKTINHTIEYLGGMLEIYGVILVQFPALLHLLYTFNYKKPILTIRRVELTLFIISVSLDFIGYYVSHNNLNL